MAFPCKHKSCTHCERDHPDPATCGGADKCTTDKGECEKFTPDYDRPGAC